MTLLSQVMHLGGQEGPESEAVPFTAHSSRRHTRGQFVPLLVTLTLMIWLRYLPGFSTEKLQFFLL